MWLRELPSALSRRAQGIHDPKTFQVIAEIGVLFLMFSIGLEFSLEELSGVKWVALIAGPLGITLSGLLGMGVGWLLGWGVMTSLTVGHIVSVASTMVLSRLLTDRGELQSQYRKVISGSRWLKILPWLS